MLSSIFPILLLTTPIFSLPGPSDVSKTYQKPSFLQNLKRQFTGAGSFPMPPPDRCYRRSDRLKACPYGGQCRPDIGYTCQTYCVNYGNTLDGSSSCNLLCGYAATSLDGEIANNPMHCAVLGEKSRIQCDSGFACYRQFSDIGPTYEQRPPVCSPRYELCDLEPVPEAPSPIPASPISASTLVPDPILIAPIAPAVNAPLVPPAQASVAVPATPATFASPLPSASLSVDEDNTPDTAQSLLDTAQSFLETAGHAQSLGIAAAAAAAVVSVVDDHDDHDDRRKLLLERQSAPGATCHSGYRCIVDPRPNLGLPARKDIRQGICVAETEPRCSLSTGTWNACGERSHCGEVASIARVKGEEDRGFCVRLLGDDWKLSTPGTAAANDTVGLRIRNVLRPMC